MEEYHPELANYEPYEPRAARSPRAVFLIRLGVIVAIAALVLPGVLTTYSFTKSTAAATCDIWVNAVEPSQHTSFVRFQVLGPSLIGWECYEITADGTHFMTSLGVMPGLTKDQQQTVRAKN